MDHAPQEYRLQRVETSELAARLPDKGEKIISNAALHQVLTPLLAQKDRQNRTQSQGTTSVVR